MVAMTSQGINPDTAWLGEDEDVLARPLSDLAAVEIDIRNSVGEECLSIAEYVSIMIFLTSKKNLLAQFGIERVEFIPDGKKSTGLSCIKNETLYIDENELKASGIEGIFERLGLVEFASGGQKLQTLNVVGADIAPLPEDRRKKLADELRTANTRRRSNGGNGLPRRQFQKVVPTIDADSLSMRIARRMPRSVVGVLNPSMRRCLDEEDNMYRENRKVIAGVVMRVLVGDRFIVRPAQHDKNAEAFNVFEKELGANGKTSEGRYAGYSVSVGKQRPAKITVLEVAKGPGGQFQKGRILFSGSFLNFRREYGAKLSEIGAPAFDF